MKRDEHTYSRDIVKKKIAILGIMPPPLGGVSVHIQRVIDLFAAQQNKLFFFNTEQRLRSLFFPFYLMRVFGWLIRVRPELVYYHSSYLKTSLAELMMITLLKSVVRFKLCLIDHDCRHLNMRGERYKKWFRWVASRCDQIVCIGQSTLQSYHDNVIECAALLCEPAFIPPALHRADAICVTYPSSLEIFLQEHTPLFLLSAAHIMIIDDKEIYGIESSIRMLCEIKNRYPDAGLIIGLSSVGNKDRFAQLRSIMNDLDVSEQVYILQGNKELWPLFQKIDLFLRPTLSDGDSIAVREALYFNVPVVASDSVVRPLGVQIYNSNDKIAFANMVCSILKERVYGNHQQHNHLHEESSC